jgi:hypothetical protein
MKIANCKQKICQNVFKAEWKVGERNLRWSGYASFFYSKLATSTAKLVLWSLSDAQFHITFLVQKEPEGFGFKSFAPR